MFLDDMRLIRIFTKIYEIYSLMWISDVLFSVLQ